MNPALVTPGWRPLFLDRRLPRARETVIEHVVELTDMPKRLR